MIDVQVINDQQNLNSAHSKKVDKYYPLHDQLNGLRPGRVMFSSFTCNLGVVLYSKTHLKIFSIFNYYQKLTLRCCHQGLSLEEWRPIGISKI